jgi:hypothetical protein
MLERRSVVWCQQSMSSSKGGGPQMLIVLWPWMRYQTHLYRCAWCGTFLTRVDVFCSSRCHDAALVSPPAGRCC